MRDWIDKANGGRCQICGGALSGRQRKYDSAACRAAAYRDRAESDSGPETSTSVKREFLARFDGVDFDPWEMVLVNEAAEAWAVLVELRAMAKPTPRVLREMRSYSDLLRRLLGSVAWPSEASQATWAGRKLARARWA